MTPKEIHAAAVEALKLARDAAGLPAGVLCSAYLWPPETPRCVGFYATWRVAGREDEYLDHKVHVLELQDVGSVALRCARFVAEVKERVAVGNAHALAEALIAESCKTERCVEHKHGHALAAALSERSERSVGTTRFFGVRNGRLWHVELT